MAPRALCVAVFAALVGPACQAHNGDVEIEDVRVLSTIEHTTIRIDVRNKGDVAAWVHVWPWRLAVDGDELIVALHGREPGLEHAPGAITPVISYERLSRSSVLTHQDEHTIEIAMGNEFGPLDERVFIPDLDQVVVELAWHDHDPGSSVTLEQAPDPTDVAFFTTPTR